MKTIKENLKFNLSLIISAIMLVPFTGCNNCARPVEENVNQEISSHNIKPPAVDIHTAAFMGNIIAVKQHITANTDINKIDQYGSTALITATTFNKTEVAIALIEAGANLNISNNDGSTPLHIAAFFCRKEIVEALLVNGADINLKNNFGSTAIESISGPFENVKPIYDQISKDLGPLGLKLDYEHIEKTRTIIAEMLQQ